jgi:large subunit ribosomal protein L30
LRTVAEKTLKMIRIKWVRSGIGFTYHQKTIVRSLGLNKLNHTVVRPDTPQIRGIVAAVPHLLEIVPEPVAPAWASIPEYTIHAPVAAPAAPAESTPVATAEATGESAKADQEIESAPEGSESA